jgi:hypothetical protein
MASPEMFTDESRETRSFLSKTDEKLKEKNDLLDQTKTKHEPKPFIDCVVCMIYQAIK